MDDQELELIKEEYRRLSQEVNNALAHRLQVVQFGLALLGVLTGLALQSTDRTSIIFIWAFMIPGAGFMILYLWLSEIRRARRASWYIFGLETRVNNGLRSRVLGWEGDLRRKDSDNLLAVFRGHYVTTALFFISIALLSAIYGMWNWYELSFLYQIAWPTAFGALIVAIADHHILHYFPKFDLPNQTWFESLSEQPGKANVDKKNLRNRSRQTSRN